MAYYLVVETYPRWLVDRANEYKERVFSKRYERILFGIEVGDRVVVYVASNIASFAAICEVTNRSQRCNLSLKEVETWDGVFSIRMYTKPIRVLSEKNFVSCRPLVAKLDFLPNKKNWGCALQKSIKEISERDYRIIEKEVVARPRVRF